MSFSKRFSDAMMVARAMGREVFKVPANPAFTNKAVTIVCRRCEGTGLEPLKAEIKAEIDKRVEQTPDVKVMSAENCQQCGGRTYEKLSYKKVMKIAREKAGPKDPHKVEINLPPLFVKSVRANIKLNKENEERAASEVKS